MNISKFLLLSVLLLSSCSKSKPVVEFDDLTCGPDGLCNGYVPVDDEPTGVPGVFRGMSSDEVFELLGAPESVSPGILPKGSECKFFPDVLSKYYYVVYFDEHQRVLWAGRNRTEKVCL